MNSKKDEREEKKIKKDEEKEIKSKKDEATTVKKRSKAKKDESKVEKEKGTKVDESKAKKENKTKVNKAEVEKKENNPKMNKPKIGRKCFRMIWSIICKMITIIIICICIIIVVQKVTNNEESFLGFRIFRVQTGSMIPKYQIGDVILVKETDPDKIQIGDDVTYEGETGSMSGLIVTHRVIDIEEADGKRIFHTKGIANTMEDPVISEDQINGVVQTKMYILSLICLLLINKYVFYFCGIVPLTIYVAFRLFKGKKVKRIEREDE